MDVILFSQELIMQYHLFGVFISTLLFYTIILPLPADAVVFFAGSLGATIPLLHPAFVTIVASVAATIAGLVAYAIGFEADKILLKEKHGKNYRKAEDYLERYGFWAIVFFAFSPLPMDIMGLIAGALNYDWKKFVIASFIGRFFRCLILSYAGYTGTQFILNIFQWIF